MRRSSLHHRFQALAWLAMLLVLLAPLVSRWLAHGHVAAAAAVVVMDHTVHAQHAMEGHHDHHAMAQQHDKAASTPSAVDPHAEHEMGVDCDYCLIAARLITLLVAALLLLAPLAPVCRALRGAVQALPQRISGTLGARGPPASLVA